MEFLRSIVKWITHHKSLGILSLTFVIAAFIGIRITLNRLDGDLTPPIQRGQIVDAVYGIGTVTATHSYSIKPGIIATLGDVYVKEGDSVVKGAQLARIENVIYRAPFSGIVNYLPFKVGENVFTQLPTLVLTDLSDRYIVVNLEQQGALRIHPGQAALLNFDSIRSQTFTGVVKSVYSYNGNFLARVDVSSLPPEILPDMTADIAIIVRKVEKALVVPTTAIDGSTVWVKRPLRLPFAVPVKLGVIDGTMAEVIEGDLHEGDQLLIRRKVGP